MGLDIPFAITYPIVTDISSQGESSDRWNKHDLKNYSEEIRNRSRLLILVLQLALLILMVITQISLLKIVISIFLLPLRKELDYVLNILFLTLCPMIIYLLRIVPLSLRYLLYLLHRGREKKLEMRKWRKAIVEEMNALKKKLTHGS